MTEMTFSDWDGTGTWEGMLGPRQIQVHIADGESYRDGIPRWVAHIGFPGKEPRSFVSTVRMKLVNMIETRYAEVLTTVIGIVEL